MKRYILLLLISFCGAQFSSAKITLPAILGNNMVLQQKSKVNLWGMAQKSTKVSITTSWDNKEYSVISSSSGEWLVQVETPVGGGPYAIHITDGEEIKLSNILIGEVWLCSGQSNMGMRIKGNPGEPVEHALEELMEANPANNIRIANVKINGSVSPLFDCTTEWKECTPGTVADFSAAAYFFARYIQKALNVPVGIICSAWGGSKIEPWIKKEVFEQEFPGISLDVLKKNYSEIEHPRSEPTLIYNAMIHPIRNYTIKGALWYQGEANREAPDLYKRLFPAMVKSWREEWKQGDFPFFYAQIAPHCYGTKRCDETEAAELRQIQLECLDIIPNSGMVVTADIGQALCIHPPKKKEVGQRFALWALAKAYGIEDIPCSGPIFKSFIVKNREIIIDFYYSESGLNSKDQQIAGFEIAGADNVFYPADAKLVEKKTKISVSSEKVLNPAKVRYAFRNFQPVDLFNNYGLPASPFKAD
ncbi:sialate O-acetylesterase [Dysgonomonas gadei]|uniref:sialate O-acetylesterase n=1 Tax=Dysgonomonas gadei TaxID=156974 RepID=UPI003AF02014